jgi:endogenous inhibitor of DNA gyrase (YacG/DUF329 family)
MQKITKTWVNCPYCGKRVNKDETKHSTHFPFCSRRCKLADLEGWLGNRYKIPAFLNTENTKE